MLTEQQRIQTLADKVGKTLSLPSYPVYMVDIDPLDPIPNMAFNVLDRVFLATPGILDTLGTELMTGVLAHEYGHTVERINPFDLPYLTSVQRQAFETHADKFAADHGFGRQLMKVNKLVLSLDPAQDSDGIDHPKMSTRLAKLEQWTREYEETQMRDLHSRLRIFNRRHLDAE